MIPPSTYVRGAFCNPASLAAPRVRLRYSASFGLSWLGESKYLYDRSYFISRL